MASLFFSEFCDERGYDYFDPRAREAWEQYCRHDPSKDPPPLPPPSSAERAAWRLWRNQQEVAEREELRRREGRKPVCFIKFYRLIFPPPIPILSLPALAHNEWLGYRGLD